MIAAAIDENLLTYLKHIELNDYVTCDDVQVNCFMDENNIPCLVTFRNDAADSMKKLFKFLHGDILSYKQSRCIIESSHKSDVMKWLWASGKLLCETKEKLGLVLNDFKELTAEDMILTHTHKLKKVQDNYYQSLDTFQSFLQAYILHDQSLYTKYQLDCQRSFADNLAMIKEFLIWFREIFPYYHNECDKCKNKEGNTYLGCIAPNQEESLYDCSRTELYLCKSCSHITRFPRYNDVSAVLHTRKGRCGEYSMLMMRFLQALGYHARWTVDKADHVWTEVYLLLDSNDNDYNSSTSSSSSSSSSNRDDNRYTLTNSGRTGRWVHVDPCEASINEPYIYQSWGKKPTFIFAYNIIPTSFQRHTPPTEPNTDSYACVSNILNIQNDGDMNTQDNLHEYHQPFPFSIHVQDVTTWYTTEDITIIQERRIIDNVTQDHINLYLKKAEKVLYDNYYIISL